MKLHVLNYTLEKNDFVEDTITTFLNTLPYPYKYIAEKGKKQSCRTQQKIGAW